MCEAASMTARAGIPRLQSGEDVKSSNEKGRDGDSYGFEGSCEVLR